jgi:diguanylate cyclase (GGDEF)-like protein
VSDALTRGVDVPPDGRFASRAATFLFLGAGAAAFVNTLLGNLQRVDVAALRVTGVVSCAFALIVAVLPWDRHYRLVTNMLIATAIVMLAGSEVFTHYARSPGAPAVYPVFFIVVVTWAGLVREKGVATGVAVLSAPVLYEIMASGANASIAGQCVIVTMPVAAVLGEVLSWNAHRARAMTAVERMRRLNDPLTGLANRTLLSIQLEHALARSRRGHGALAVYFIDVDRFKQVNDTLGHNGGDELLIEIAARLMSAVRGSDTVARVGGDEFVVLCEDLTSVRDATEVAQRLLDVAKVSPSSSSQESITISVGIAYSEMGSETGEELLKNADLALYLAKQEGRARFEVFGEALRRRVAVRRELELALREGISRDELRVHFQPIIDIHTGKIATFEALVRWERPGFGLMPPAHFIEVAEESGLIVDLGAWVIQHAFERAAEWSARRPDRRIGVSVNLSATQLASGSLVDVVSNALEASGLDPRLVTLEITESTVIERSIGVEPQLHRMRELGANLAIDDFGTGYSSLTYLRRLPINIVKIDRSFIQAIGTEREDAAIVDAITSLSRRLGFRVVAEGVETPEQLATLVHLNCDFVQGFLFSKPRPADELAELIAAEPLTIKTSAPGHVPDDSRRFSPLQPKLAFGPPD